MSRTIHATQALDRGSSTTGDAYTAFLAALKAVAASIA